MLSKINKRVFTVLLHLLILITGVAQKNYIYVSDAGNFQSPPWQILRFDENGQNGIVFTKEQLNWPQDILFIEHKNEALISNFQSLSISRHDASTGKFLNVFAYNIGGPTRMKIGKDGLLYVLQWSGNGKVKRYDLEGNWIDDFTKTAVPTSIGIDWDSSGNLYVSSYSSKYVEKFNADGESLGKFIASGLSGPTNIEFDEDGNLLVLDYDAGVVRKFDKNGNKISDLTTGVGQCEGLHLMQNGNFLVGVGSKSSIKEYNKNGQFIKDVVLQGNLGLKTPNAVVVRPVSTKTINPKYSNAWLYSCSGNECTPNKELIQSIESVEIYNSTGQLVQKLKPDQSFSKDSPEQILIAVGINGDGKILHQIIL